MGTGFLKVELRIGDEPIPVVGAKVLIKSLNGEIMHELTTDESGQTLKVALPAPALSNTLSPDSIGPYYSAYDVMVIPDEKIQKVTIRGVQIFDTQLAILPVILTPQILRRGANELYEEIVIEPNDGLHNNSRRKDNIENELDKFGVEILETPPGFREVIIPETIVVHLGTPNSTARNVRVKFIDYLKNVASSEIFPTWPVESLKANIYAQISFVLNRVYTVWYRSRGFDFDITNSTATDQAFIYGRDVFESVSVIVDEVFNNFIRRQGRNNPYFAEYCNGSTVQCRGMSQWGTVPLAQSGKKAIEILKEYYPKDINIDTSNNFSNNLETYPGRALREGDKNNDVQKMQRYLNRIRVNFPKIPQITEPNGFFGGSTTRTVKIFQEVFDFPSDGVIGKNTWYKITSVYIAVTKLAELESEGDRIGIGLYPPTSVIKVGSKGADVLELQYLLTYIGAFYESIPSVIQDAFFDDETKRAVVEFQKLFRMKPDGVVGPQTWKELYDVYKEIEKIGSIPTPPIEIEVSKPFPGTILRVGSRGEDVLLMQTYLNELSKVHDMISPIEADSIFGEEMKESVIQFQRRFALTPDGLIGKNTWDKITIEYTKLNTSTIIPPFPGTVLRVGSTGNNVTIMQNYLNTIGTVFTTIGKLQVDGIFGNSMKNSVIAFQKQFGLSADGIIGRDTWNRIVQEYDKINESGRSEVYPGTALRVGSLGSSVLLMQQYLNKIGLTHTSIPRLEENGNFDERMKTAVIAFQTKFGLTADGVIGEKTWNAIVKEYNTPTSPTESIPFPGTILRVGSRGDDVSLMQKYLNQISSVYPSINKLIVDGIFGAKMETSVKTFQKIFNLKDDGLIGKSTWDAIVREYDKINSNRAVVKAMFVAQIMRNM